jgi:hypothetical protein
VVPWGEGGLQEGAPWRGTARRELGAGCPWCSAAPCCSCVLSVGEEDHVGKKGKRRERKRKERKRK